MRWQNTDDRQISIWLCLGGCPGVPVHEGIPFVFITIHGVMTQFVNVSFLCVPVHEDTTVWEYNVTQQKFIVIQQEIDERLALSSFVFATIYLTLELDF